MATWVKKHWQLLLVIIYIAGDVLNFWIKDTSYTFFILRLLMGPVKTIWLWVTVPVVGFLLFFVLWLRLFFKKQESKQLISSAFFDDSPTAAAYVKIYAKGNELVECEVIPCCKKCKTPLVYLRVNVYQQGHFCPKNQTGKCDWDTGIEGDDLSEFESSVRAIVKKDFVSKNKKYSM